MPQLAGSSAMRAAALRRALSPWAVPFAVPEAAARAAFDAHYPDAELATLRPRHVPCFAFEADGLTVEYSGRLHFPVAL